MRPDVGLQSQFKQMKAPKPHRYDPFTNAKEVGARRWVAAVNADRSLGRWAYRLIKFPTDTSETVRSAADELASS